MVNQLDASEPRWFAVHTRVKCEKLVVNLLSKKRVHAYVPLVRTLKRYERKVKKVEKPLISCYVFVRIVKDEYVSVLETENVAGFVRFKKDLLAIPEVEIEVLRRIVLENDIELVAVPGSIQSGDPVVITAGPLTGVQGTVVALDGKRRLQVELQRLGYSLLLTIDAAFVAKTGVF